jgi:hypothetical protein
MREPKLNSQRPQNPQWTCGLLISKVKLPGMVDFNNAAVVNRRYIQGDVSTLH